MVLKLTRSKLTLVNGLSFLLDPFIQLAPISSNFSSILPYFAMINKMRKKMRNKNSFIVMIFSYAVIVCNIVNLCIMYMWAHLQNEILTICLFI